MHAPKKGVSEDVFAVRLVMRIVAFRCRDGWCPTQPHEAQSIHPTNHTAGRPHSFEPMQIIIYPIPQQTHAQESIIIRLLDSLLLHRSILSCNATTARYPHSTTRTVRISTHTCTGMYYMYRNVSKKTYICRNKKEYN